MRLRDLVFASFAVAATFAGCAVDSETPSEPAEDAPVRRQKIGKADLWGSCETSDDTWCGMKAQPGNCYCDKACITYGDCCNDYAETCEGGETPKTCAEIGGACMSSPLDVTFPANCETDFGLDTSDALCPAFNQACCVQPECGQVFCELYCEHGFETDETGCEICSCKDAPPQFCGGFGNIQCPEGKVCVDDPDDGCDPNNGGADCGGICVDPSPCEAAGGTCHDGLAICDAGTVPSSASCGNDFIETTCCLPEEPSGPSCAGNCGNAAPGKACYCDELCTSYGDCCDDYDAVCGEREIASGMCVKNGLESCTTDADCVAGGCGGELCYNPNLGGGFSTCECAGPAAPVDGCGCVNGQCAWYTGN
jgi:hypothetical protein